MDNSNYMFQMHLLQKEQQLRQMEAEFKALQHEYHNILNSRFWKSTQWIRNIINKVRRHADYKPVFIDNPRQQDSTVFPTRLPAEEMINTLKTYDVISFDIFDTLILRNCRNPVDVFDIVALKIGYESFSSLRIQAESAAREKTENSVKEVSLEQIYDILCQWIDIDKETTMKYEIEAELSLCIANGYMKKIFDTLRALNKQIIIVSDMYLSKNTLSHILSNCGYYGYEELYVSNEYNLSKADGSLYDYLNNIYSGKKIIHIGDNYVSDIENCEKRGWHTFYYPSCKSIGHVFSTATESPVGDIYSGIVVNKFFNGISSYSISYRHGYTYGGLLAIGYCQWLEEFAKQKRADKILFLARDAEIFETVFRKYVTNIPHEYMVVSRFAMWQIVFTIHTEEYIRFFFLTRARAGDTTIENALSETDLPFLVDKLESENISPDTNLNLSSYNQLRDFIYKYKSLIADYFRPQRDAAVKYFNHCFGNAKRIILSDVGWSGQILLHMRHFVKDIMKRNDVEIIGAYVATSMRKDVNHYVNIGTLNAFLNTYGQNREMYIPIDNYAGNTSVMCLEAMFSSASPTLMEYKLSDNGEYDFIYGNITNVISNINDIQHGILDFISDWLNQMKKIDVKLTITAADAFSPYELVAMDWPYLSEVFGDYREYTDSIPRLGKSRESITLKQIMISRGLL